MTYRLEHPLNTLLDHRFIKREAEPETSYVIKSKVDNPQDGTKYALDVQVDKNGYGHSHQQIERQGAVVPLRDNYLMDLNVIDQRQMDQRQMGRTMHRDRLSNHRIRDQERLDS